MESTPWPKVPIALPVYASLMNLSIRRRPEGSLLPSGKPWDSITKRSRFGNYWQVQRWETGPTGHEDP